MKPYHLASLIFTLIIIGCASSRITTYKPLPGGGYIKKTTTTIDIAPEAAGVLKEGIKILPKVIKSPTTNSTKTNGDVSVMHEYEADVDYEETNLMSFDASLCCNCENNSNELVLTLSTNESLGAFLNAIIPSSIDVEGESIPLNGTSTFEVEDNEILILEWGGSQSISVSCEDGFQLIEEEVAQSLLDNNNKATHEDVKEVESDYKLSLFPNPGHGQFNITATIPNSGNYQIEIFNIHGERAYEENSFVIKGIYKKTISLDLSPGMYYMKTTIGKEVIVKHMVIF